MKTMALASAAAGKVLCNLGDRDGTNLIMVDGVKKGLTLEEFLYHQQEMDLAGDGQVILIESLEEAQAWLLENVPTDRVLRLLSGLLDPTVPEGLADLLAGQVEEFLEKRELGELGAMLSAASPEGRTSALDACLRTKSRRLYARLSAPEERAKPDPHELAQFLRYLLACSEHTCPFDLKGHVPRIKRLLCE